MIKSTDPGQPNACLPYQLDGLDSQRQQNSGHVTQLCWPNTVAFDLASPVTAPDCAKASSPDAELSAIAPSSVNESASALPEAFAFDWLVAAASHSAVVPSAFVFVTSVSVVEQDSWEFDFRWNNRKVDEAERTTDRHASGRGKCLTYKKLVLTPTPRKPKKKRTHVPKKRGTECRKTLKLEGNWNAIKESFKVKRPPEGWPK